ncbi:MAG: hypothetical protein AAFR47_08325 [Pseudomonadota bacterium]
MGRYLGTAVAVLILGGALVAGSLLLRPHRDQAYAAPGLPPMTAPEMARESYRLAPTLLEVVYAAFAETSEDAVYDTLAGVAAGDALEALYLERIGAMKGGGLEAADQEIHEIEILRLDTRQEGDRLDIDARWRVVGVVGHAEHMHVRGNIYDAGFAIEPVDGAWRFTGFTLRDVDRTGAGETFRAPDAPPASEAG